MSRNAAKIPWLAPGAPFPSPDQALDYPPGLLAAGSDLTVSTLRSAYSQGIFPWFNTEDPILWWSPAPRMVLNPDGFHISHSLGKRLKQIGKQQAKGNFETIVKVDTAFGQVIKGCANTPRQGQPGTWITPAMQKAYCEWHEQGQVHSIETWQNGELTGGLYGISLGRMYFGESMFATRRDASKIALAHLMFFLKQQGVKQVDCQMQTLHLESLGARPVSRHAFMTSLGETINQPAIPWQSGWLDSAGNLHPD